jgi:UDP:flavonoid glycosyltransferase YjiC (YdhE family)
MAKILVTVMPIAGHVAPITGLVDGLVRRGHEVTVYTGSRYLDSFATLGAATICWFHAPDFDEHDFRATFTSLPKRAGPLTLLSNLEHIFIRSAAGQTRDLLEAYDSSPWEVMVGDQLCLGLALAGELLGCPWVSVSIVPLAIPSRDLPPPGLALGPGRGFWGRLRDRILRATFRLATARLQRAYQQTRVAAGLARSPRRLDDAWWSPWLILATGVPALEYPRSDLPPQVYFVGALTPATKSGQSAVPTWWPEFEATTKQVIHVTQGTLNTNPGQLLEPALRALQGLDVLVVAATGSQDSTLPFAAPTNARVGRFLPYTLLLPRVDVMITNGGWGGVLAGLAHGIPLIVAGGDIDKPEIAARVAASGAGIDLRTGRPSAKRILRAYQRISLEPAFRTRAAEIADELARHDSEAEICELLEELLERGGPLTRAS